MKKVSPKKHLGQHFLTDENIAKKIIDAIAGHQGPLIEVGPGMGVLTKHLIDREGFQAHDIDVQSIGYLKEKYPQHEPLFLHQDFLKNDLQGYRDLGIIGNFPYNISSQIFFKVYDNRNQIQTVVGMVQKEVAERIVSKEGSKTYGILSVLLQAFFDIEYLFTVKPGSFYPPPKVNSAVLRMHRNKQRKLPCDEILFRKVVKMGFGKRRKTLRNALKELNLSPDLESQNVFSQRAEQLTVNDFITLTRMINGED